MLTQEEINYCRADSSDPFNAARIEAHKRVGITLPRMDERTGQWIECSYSAREVWENVALPPGQHLSNGDTSYLRRAYRDMERP